MITKRLLTEASVCVQSWEWARKRDSSKQLKGLATGTNHFTRHEEGVQVGQACMCFGLVGSKSTCLDCAPLMVKVQRWGSPGSCSIWSLPSKWAKGRWVLLPTVARNGGKKYKMK